MQVRLKYWFAGTLVFCLFGAASDASEAGAPECKTLNSGCAICSDGQMRLPHQGTKGLGKKLKTTPYACATKTGELKKKAVLPQLQNCVAVSDFCAVCEDGQFIFLKTGESISSDFYECATRPRTMIQE